MQSLIRGIHSFQSTYFSANRALFEALAGGQSPSAAFITCADSRLVPSLITGSGPGELFTIRNAGNLIPAYDPGCSSGEAASIQYAVEVLEVENIIVCGHTGCGAIDAVLHPERAAKLELVRAWVSHAERTRRIVEERYGHLKGEELATAAVEENVLVQLENLRTYPFIADRFTTPERRLHGWVFDIASGKVYTYDAELEDFVPLSPPPEPPAPPPV